MDRSINNLGSSLKFLQEKLNIISNNLANTDTIGYKKDTVIGKGFDNILASKIQDQLTVTGAEQIEPSALEEYTPGVYAERIYTSLLKGNIQQTGDYADIAFSGDGFLVVGDDNSKIYLSCASTDIDEEGFLIATGRGRIQGLNGDMRVGFEGYTIEQNGFVLVNGEVVDVVKVVDFTDKSAVSKNSDGDFIVANDNIVDKEDFLILPGHLEASNVNTVAEITELIEVARRFETNQRTLQILDELYGIAINNVGRL